MDHLNLQADRVEALPDWQEAAYAAIRKLPEWTCQDTGRKNTAKMIVLSMEADCILSPAVLRNDRTGAITMMFLSAERSVEFTITAPDVFQVFLWSLYERSRKTHHKGWPGLAARRAIRWLFPTSHATDERGMYQVMREGL